MSTEIKDLVPFAEDTELKVGKIYNVKCAIIQTGPDKVSYVPIIGSNHADPQFGTKHTHYHIDGRFCKLKHMDKSGQTNHPVWTDPGHWESQSYKGTIVIKRRCARLTTGLKIFNAGNPFGDWYKTMIGKSCAGRKCPHRGTHMLERDGRLLCPLHNLQGSIEDEVIIPRIELECQELHEAIRQITKDSITKS